MITTVRGKSKCSECGLPCFYFGGWRLDSYCENGHPPRASKVIRGIPRWVVVAVDKAYATAFHGPAPYRANMRIASRNDVELFLINKNVISRCLIGFTDHMGHDTEGNLITEPYAAHCAGCQADAEAFAARIGAKYTLTPMTWWAPWIKQCVRMTFSKPGVS